MPMGRKYLTSERAFGTMEGPKSACARATRGTQYTMLRRRYQLRGKCTESQFRTALRHALLN